MKNINLINDCTVEIIDNHTDLKIESINGINELKMYYPTILFKYNNKTILIVDTYLEYINGKSGLYSRLDIMIKTNIGNIIKENISYRKTEFYLKDYSRKEKIKKIKRYKFQLESFNFFKVFNYIMTIIYSYYSKKGIMPEVCCYQRFTGNSIKKSLENEKEPDYKLFFVNELIKKYNLKSIDINIIKKIKKEY